MSPARLAHLKAEVAANDRKLGRRRLNWNKHDINRAVIRDRQMRNCGMRPENALNPAWDWLSPSTLSSLNTPALKSQRMVEQYEAKYGKEALEALRRG